MLIHLNRQEHQLPRPSSGGTASARVNELVTSRPRQDKKKKYKAEQAQVKQAFRRKTPDTQLTRHQGDERREKNHGNT